MNTIEQLKKESQCYGKAFDADIKECKLCFCNKECKALTSGKVLKPELPLADKVSKELSNKTKSDKINSVQYPDFKNMSMEDLEKLANERQADPSWQRFNNQGIRRMRLTMALKKTYVSKGE
jgi:hypothetical protein